MHFPSLRIPARIIEHPIESVIACLLLLALLFVSGEPSSTGASAMNDRTIHSASETFAKKM